METNMQQRNVTPELLKRLEVAKSAEEIQCLFEKEGLPLKEGATYEDVYQDLVGHQDKELTEEELDQVSGGSVIAVIGTVIGAYLIFKYVRGVIIGFCEG